MYVKRNNKLPVAINRESQTQTKRASTHTTHTRTFLDDTGGPSKPGLLFLLLTRLLLTQTDTPLDRMSAAVAVPPKAAGWASTKVASD